MTEVGQCRISLVHCQPRLPTFGVTDSVRLLSKTPTSFCAVPAVCLLFMARPVSEWFQTLTASNLISPSSRFCFFLSFLPVNTVIRVCQYDVEVCMVFIMTPSGERINSRVLVLVNKNSEDDSIDPRFSRRKLIGKALLLETVNKFFGVLRKLPPFYSFCKM